MSVSRANSATSISTTASFDKTERRSSSISKAWKATTAALSQHHREVQGAYEAMYGRTYSTGSQHKLPATSTVSEEQQILEAVAPADAKQSRASRAWEKVKQHAREHHEGVNSAHAALYGGARR